MFIIYALCDQKNEEIRYIGKSTVGLKRPKSHWRDRKKARYKAYYVYRWLNKLEAAPIIKVLEECEHKEDLSEREQFWIATHHGNGRLTNMTMGGEGTVGRKHSAETRKKLSQAKIGKPGPMLGRKLPEEVKSKMRNKVVTPEARASYSKAQTERFQRTDELERAKIHLAECREKRMKSVKCSNGMVFDSIGDASRALNIAKPNIIAVLKGRYKQIMGFHFEYN